MGLFDLKNKNTPENAIKQQMNLKVSFINNKYTEIGRYVKLNLADKIENEDIKTLIKQIDSALADLKALDEQLNMVRGIKLCPNCNREIPLNVGFCPSCGAKQPAMQNAPVYSQPSPVPSPVPNPVPVPTNVVPPSEPVVQPASTPVQGDTAQPFVASPVIAETLPTNEGSFVFCTQCGKQESSGVKFCSNCGNPL